MIKRILVPLDVSDYSEAVTTCACHAALYHNAEASCLTVLDIGGIKRMKYNRERGEQEALARLSVVEEKFKEVCESLGVQYSILEDRNAPAQSVLTLSNYYDLVVMGQHSFFHFETDEGEDNTLRKVLAHSITPILTVPQEAPVRFQHACVIVDESPDAARAVRQFARFAEAYHPTITLVSPLDSEACRDAVGRANTYFKTRGFTNVTKLASDDDPIKTIKARQFNDLDLVVTGRHSAHRWHDLVHGDQAKEAIEHATVPVLIGL